MRVNLILFALLIHLVGFAFSGQSIDSLKAQLDTDLSVESRISTLLTLYESTKADSLNLAITFVTQALQHENQTTDVLLRSRLFSNAGEVYYSIRKVDSSLIYYQKALNLQLTSQDTAGLASTYMEIGLAHYSKNELKKAMEYYLLAEPLVQRLRDEAKAIDLNNRMVFILIQQEQLEQALGYLFANYKKLRKGSVTPETIKTSFNIANCLKRSKDSELALAYADSTALFSNQVGFDFGKAKALGMQAYILLDLHRPDDALLRINDAEAIFAKMGVEVELFQLAIARSRVFQEKKAYPAMVASVKQARERLGDIEDTELLIELYDVEYVAYKNTGNHQRALESYEKFSALQDSIFKVTNAEKINELLTKYEAEKKDAEIQNLSQQSQIQALEITQRKNQLIAISVGVLLLILIGMVLVQQRRLKYKQQAADLEQRLLRLQMNPHFIFNALGSIQSYILENQTNQSVSYLARFAKLMRQILEHSREEFIPIEQETEMLGNYLAIQQLRFANRFTYSIELDDKIDPAEDRIPPLFAQPLVENAIEHGFSDVQTGGLLTIRFWKMSEQIELTITDNGKGISTQSTSMGHKSLATVITKDRLSLLSKKAKGKFSLNLESGPEGGTIARLILPLAT